MKGNYNHLKEIARAREEAKFNEWWLLGGAKKEGREEGIASVALNLLAENVPIDLICKATGLSVEDIKNLALQQ
jgi:predicted transposase YdaD